jgi:hypothetical protein
MPPENTEATGAVPQNIAETKQLRKELDESLQNLKKAQLNRHTRERSLAMTKIQEAIMWLGMDLKAINEEVPGSAPNPYPSSYDPTSPKIEPTSEGLKL